MENHSLKSLFPFHGGKSAIAALAWMIMGEDKMWVVKLFMDFIGFLFLSTMCFLVLVGIFLGICIEHAERVWNAIKSPHR